MEILQPRDLGIIMTYKCQAKCRHCLYCCGPEWRDAMDIETARAALQATLCWDHRYQVHLTGGEPFLYFSLLLAATEMGARLGISCYLETNAGWCKDMEQSVEKFTALRDAGLQAVLISCSPFHAERIPLARTWTGIQAAIAVFGSSRVIVYLSHSANQIAQFGLEEPVPLTRYEDELGLPQARHILWDDYGIIPGGRAGYALARYASHSPARALRGLSCAGELLYAPHSHLDLYGNYIPGFCGGLTLGSWRDMSQLRATYRARQYPPLIEILIRAGAYGLYEFACAEYDYIERAEGYAGKCHLCVDVRRYLVKHADFAELHPREFYERI